MVLRKTDPTKSRNSKQHTHKFLLFAERQTPWDLEIRFKLPKAVILEMTSSILAAKQSNLQTETMKIVDSLPAAKLRKSGIRVILSCASEVNWSLCCGDKEVVLQHPSSCLCGHEQISAVCHV